VRGRGVGERQDVGHAHVERAGGGEREQLGEGHRVHRHPDDDVAFVREPPATPGLRLEPLWTEPLVVVLPARHPLAAAGTVDLADLFDEPAIVAPAAVNPGVFATFAAIAARAGFRPRLGEPFATRQDGLALVAAGAGWTLLPATTDLGGAAVVARPTTDPEATVTVTLALRAAGASPLVEAFADVALAPGVTTTPEAVGASA
jgi:DNA-binding transcriptional LysR family regulator